MKKVATFLLVVLLTFSQLMVSAFASGDIDLQNMTISELTELKSEIETEIESRTADAPIDESAVEDTVLSLTTSAVEKAFSDRDIAISWAWINYEYKHDGEFCSLKTHIDYKVNGRKIKPDVYSEAYPFDGQYELVFLSVGDEVLVDKRDSLPIETQTATEVSTPAPTATTFESIAKGVLHDALLSVDDENGDVTISFTLTGGWDNESTRRAFSMYVEYICKGIHSAASDGNLDFENLVFVANGDFIDVYGNTTNEKAMTCTFSKAVLNKIKWDDFLTENIPKVASDYWCHPALLKD